MSDERPDVPREDPEEDERRAPAYPKQERPTLLHDVAGLAAGLRASVQESLRKPVTTQYPEDKTPRSERYRGRHYLRRYENDLERCIGCQLCSAACPVGCILVIAAENTVENRVSPGERYAKVYEINMLRCIFCGYCEEACPVQAIVLGPEYELSDVSRERFVYTKDMLLEPPVAGGRADPAQNPDQQEPLRIG